VIVHDLSPDVVRQMIRADLAQSSAPPDGPIDEFAFHDCTCGIGSFTGRPPWERHNGGDELLFVLAGESNLTVLEETGPAKRVIKAGALVVVPRGTWHNNDAPEGVTMLYMTPTEGNEHSWEDPGQGPSPTSP
jgi:mannose-6-phosphate isomerase-like protein (cupin superfamily)